MFGYNVANVTNVDFDNNVLFIWGRDAMTKDN